MTTIRDLRAADRPALWRMLAPVFRAGDTYGLPADITEAAAWTYWAETPLVTRVAVDAAGDLLGTYYLQPNHAGPGAHVCNCGYVVAEAARGRGVATALCEDSQAEALRRGFRAMQYNFVAATNSGAVRLWQRLGFHIVGTLPGAFRHPRLGFVDAYVMYKTLV